MLNFTQINLHKASQATLLLGQEMEGPQQTISLITEPHHTAGRITGMPRGTTVISDRSISQTQPGPRAGIVARRDLGLRSLDAWCSRDCAAATAKLHGRQILIASIYLDITKPPVPGWLEGLMDMAENKKLPVILGIDSNAHSSLYGPDNNTRGDEFEDFILQHGLEVINTGDTPTFETRRGSCMAQSHIDVTLVRDLPFDITDWWVDQTYNASDHNTIRFRASEAPLPDQTIRPWSKADWPLFNDCLLYTSPSPRDRQKSRMPSSA